MHIVVQLVDQSIGVQYNDQTTAQDVIHFILSRYEIPQPYDQVCALLVDRCKIFTTPLKPDERIADNTDYKFYFRVLCLPGQSQVIDLDENFLELLNRQIHRLIQTGTWFTNEEQNIQVCAYKCIQEFGKFNAERHKVGFLGKQIESFISSDLLATQKGDKLKQVEIKILNQWKQLSNDIGCSSDRQEIIRAFIEYCSDNIKQFGCATIVAIIMKVDGEQYNTEVLFSAKHEGIRILTLDGKDILHCFYNEVTISFPEKEVDTVFYIRADKIIEARADGIHQFVKVIEFLRSTSYPSKAQVDEWKHNNES